MLHIHRADRSDALVDALAEVLADPLPDPMAFDVVAVPARGVERWITQRLSHRLGRDGDQSGVCAGIRFPSPATLIAEVVGARDADPWTPDRLVWPLLTAIDASLDEPWAAILARHLAADRDPTAPARGQRRYAVARRIAGLFDRYAADRPDMLSDWLRGLDTDGAGTPLPGDLAWQPPLWRAVGHVLDAPDPVSRVDESLQALADDPATVALPQRVSLFGLSRLPDLHARVLHALAEVRDVHLWLPHPSDALWRAVRTGPVTSGAFEPVRPPGSQSVGTGRLPRRADDPTPTLARHPLLASLGRESREMQLRLPPAGVDQHHPVDRAGTSLLHAVQQDIIADRRPSRHGPDPNDRSVSVHACHSPARQIDVLREILVGLLQDDPTLEPRDILVMCPDIEQYAPLIAAGFGLADVVDRGHPAHGLRVRLADRALRQTNPLLALATTLIELAGSRFTASEVLDLAAAPVVRRRFGFTDDDLSTITEWVAAAGIRWGWDAPHREDFGLQDFPQNTWRSGLDRILLGVTMAETATNWVERALPLDDIGSSDIDLAGRFAEFADRLAHVLDQLSGVGALDGWMTELVDAVESLAEVTAHDLWQRAELHRQLTGVIADAEAVGATTVLNQADVRALVRRRLAGRPTRANFRTGTLTVCTMVPMRSVPHRVVCLVGLDDGVFPRSAALDGDDILARAPRIGERDPRAEDRQLLLDAILAATDHLVVTYTGADDRTGAVRPPAVPLGEVLSVLGEMLGGLDQPVLVRHPLQPYDPAVVTPGRLGVDRPFTYDPAALAAAVASRESRTSGGVPVPRLGLAALPPRRPVLVDLEDLIRLLHDPAVAFCRQRLQIAVPGEAELPSDGLPVDPDGLARWSIGDSLLRRRLAGVDLADCRQVEWRRGRLPPGTLGNRMLDELCDQVEPLVEAATELRVGPAQSTDVTVPLPDGREVRGTVPGVHDDTIVRVGFSRLRPRDRLGAWVRLLVLAATRPGVEWSAVTLARGRSGGVARSTLSAPDQETARQLLAYLVDLYDRGLCAPLPIPERTAAGYAEQRHAGVEPGAALAGVEREWIGTQNFPGERDSAAARLAWGVDAPLSVLTAEPAGPRIGWPQETTRFGATACRLWVPLLTVERRSW
jgi:exodeoxyribonuclease V gamma subunit